jgi:hypothetical protein
MFGLVSREGIRDEYRLHLRADAFPTDLRSVSDESIRSAANRHHTTALRMRIHSLG